MEGVVDGYRYSPAVQFISVFVHLFGGAQPERHAAVTRDVVVMRLHGRLGGGRLGGGRVLGVHQRHEDHVHSHQKQERGGVVLQVEDLAQLSKRGAVANVPMPVCIIFS